MALTDSMFISHHARRRAFLAFTAKVQAKAAFWGCGLPSSWQRCGRMSAWRRRRGATTCRAPCSGGAKASTKRRAPQTRKHAASCEPGARRWTAPTLVRPSRPTSARSIGRGSSACAARAAARASQRSTCGPARVAVCVHTSTSLTSTSHSAAHARTAAAPHARTAAHACATLTLFSH